MQGLNYKSGSTKRERVEQAQRIDNRACVRLRAMLLAAQACSKRTAPADHG